MNDSNVGVESLYNMALNQLCHDKDIVCRLWLLQPTISLQIIWKVRHFFRTSNYILSKVTIFVVFF